MKFEALNYFAPAIARTVSIRGKIKFFPERRRSYSTDSKSALCCFSPTITPR